MYRILIVDDSPVKMRDIIQSVRGTIAGKDAEILTETCGLDALMTLMIENIDYLITDMQYCWQENKI